MTNSTNEFKAVKKAQPIEIQNKELEWVGSELQKSELPGVVETASLGEIKKPKPSK